MNHKKSVDVLLSGILMIALATALIIFVMYFLSPTIKGQENQASFENAKTTLKLITEKVQDVQLSGKGTIQKLSISFSSFTITFNDNNNFIQIDLQDDSIALGTDYNEGSINISKPESQTILKADLNKNIDLNILDTNILSQGNHNLIIKNQGLNALNQVVISVGVE